MVNWTPVAVQSGVAVAAFKLLAAERSWVWPWKVNVAAALLPVGIVSCAM
jgi:hypothetical protein